jgi:DNA repair ATPase RecN
MTTYYYYPPAAPACIYHHFPPPPIFQCLPYQREEAVEEVVVAVEKEEEVEEGIRQLEIALLSIEEALGELSKATRVSRAAARHVKQRKQTQKQEVKDYTALLNASLENQNKLTGEVQALKQEKDAMDQEKIIIKCIIESLRGRCQSIEADRVKTQGKLEKMQKLCKALLLKPKE